MKEFDINELKKFLKEFKSQKDEEIINKILEGEKLDSSEIERAFYNSLPWFSLALLNKRYEESKVKAEQKWKNSQKVKLENIGSVKNLEILPLIDKKAEGDLHTESGVAYYIEADDKIILFDTGLNDDDEHPSPLLKNMESLGVNVKDIVYIVISHKHGDHIGGKKWAKNDTFGLSGEQLDLSDVKAYTPVPMKHPSASVKHVDEPMIISDGIVSIGSIQNAMFFWGLIAEQALAINVEGKGIVLIVGCGHQSIQKIIDRTEELFDIPIYGIIGGLHLPIPKFPDLEDWMGLPFYKFIMTRRPIWEPWNKDDVSNAINYLKKRNIKLISISPHDSSDESIEAFRTEFGDIYVDLRVGKRINVTK